MAKATKPALDVAWLQSTSVPTVALTPSARLLGVDPRTLKRAVLAGEIPAIRLYGKTLIPRAVLLELLRLEDLSGHVPAA